MINVQCKNCGSIISKTMKFAIMKNMCPACGSTLFSNREMTELSVMESKIMKQDFAKSMDEFAAYDISLFVMSEIQEAITKLATELAERKDKEIKDLLPEEEVETEIISDKDKIREEIEKEFIPSISTSPASEEIYIEKVTPDARVDKLKNIYDQHKMNKKINPIVRRSDY